LHSVPLFPEFHSEQAKCPVLLTKTNPFTKKPELQCCPKTTLSPGSKKKRGKRLRPGTAAHSGDHTRSCKGRCPGTGSIGAAGIKPVEFCCARNTTTGKDVIGLIQL